MNKLENFREFKIQKTSAIYGQAEIPTEHRISKCEIQHDVWCDNDNDAKLSVGDTICKTYIEHCEI